MLLLLLLLAVAVATAATTALVARHLTELAGLFGLASLVCSPEAPGLCSSLAYPAEMRKAWHGVARRERECMNSQLDLR